MTTIITEDQIEEFQENGAILLKSVFSNHWIRKLEKGIAENHANPSQYSERLRGDTGGTGYYFNDYCNWRKIQEFYNFVFFSPAAEIAGRLMRSKECIFYHEHVLTKDADTSKATPWHTDQSYYPIDGEKICSIWLPVDSVPLEYSIQFVRGSYRWGKWFYPKKFATENNYPLEFEDTSAGKTFHDVPDDDIGNGKYELLSWRVNPGDCVVFHGKTIHGAPGNFGSQPRQIFSTRWLGDDAVLATRPWAVSPPVTGGLTNGESVKNSTTFPVVWSAADDPAATSQ